MNSTLNIVQYRNNQTLTINRQHCIQYCYQPFIEIYIRKEIPDQSASDKEIIKFVFYNKTLLLTLRCHQETFCPPSPLPPSKTLFIL